MLSHRDPLSWSSSVYHARRSSPRLWTWMATRALDEFGDFKPGHWKLLGKLMPLNWWFFALRELGIGVGERLIVCC